MTHEQLFKQIAESIRPKGLAGHSTSFFDAGYRQGIELGLSLMYAALGWRVAGEPVAVDGSYKVLLESGYIGFGIFLAGESVLSIHATATHYLRDNPPPPTDLTTLEKLLMEQINKGGK